MNIKYPDSIEHLPTETLTPYARNARTHSPEQIGQIAASIQEFGFTNPILIDAKNEIIAGHGRVMAAQQLGIETLPCIRLGHLTENQKRAYVIADNQIALNSGWDENILSLEITLLNELDFNIDLMGFDDEKIQDLLTQEIANPINKDYDKSNEQQSKKDGILYVEKYAVLIECENEKDQQDIYEKITNIGLKCKVLVN